MNVRFIQENCVEGSRVDLRQANVVKKYRPDIILFEMPAGRNGPGLAFNKFGPEEKPFKKVAAKKEGARIAARTFPYAMSDFYVWENIEALWREGHNVLLFNIDGPKELRAHRFKTYGRIPYPALIRSWWFWAYQLMRELEMRKNIEAILRQYGTYSARRPRERPVIAVFLQSIHWDHVRFLLTHPSKRSIWKYYFGNFPKVTPANIKALLKEKDEVLYRYWVKTEF
jgi:hypothetical protein